MKNAINTMKDIFLGFCLKYSLSNRKILGVLYKLFWFISSAWPQQDCILSFAYFYQSLLPRRLQVVYNEKQINIYFFKKKGKKSFWLRQTIAFGHKTQLQASSQPNVVGEMKTFVTLIVKCKEWQSGVYFKKIFPGSHFVIRVLI